MSLNAFGDSSTSRSSFVPTGLAVGSPLAAPPPFGSGAGLAAGGGAGAGPAAGRAGSGDLPAHAHASKTVAVNVARIHNIFVITAR